MVWRTVYLSDIDPNGELRGTGLGGAEIVDRFLRCYQRVMEGFFPGLPLEYAWKRDMEGMAEDHADDAVVFCNCDSTVVPCGHHEEVLRHLRDDRTYAAALAALASELEG